MFKRMEVLTLMAHLIISLFVLGGYLFTVAIGQPDTTLQNLALIIGGYWFGAVGGTKVKDVLQKRKEDKQNPGGDS